MFATLYGGYMLRSTDSTEFLVIFYTFHFNQLAYIVLYFSILLNWYIIRPLVSFFNAPCIFIASEIIKFLYELQALSVLQVIVLILSEIYFVGLKATLALNWSTRRCTCACARMCTHAFLVTLIQNVLVLLNHNSDILKLTHDFSFEYIIRSVIQRRV
jgi:hypothetical protein